jgi:quinolinate synthase
VVDGTAREYIVATDNGMMHKLRTLNPGKVFIEAPTAGNSATCKSCAHCPWMAMNGLAGLAHVLETGTNEVLVDPALGERARLPIDRMLAFTAALKSGRPAGSLVPEIGAACTWGGRRPCRSGWRRNSASARRGCSMLAARSSGSSSRRA